jgi:hypothetical protein
VTISPWNMNDDRLRRYFGDANMPKVRERILARDVNGEVEYIGYTIGDVTATSKESWIVAKTIKDVNGDYVYTAWSGPNQIADNYASLTYT